VTRFFWRLVSFLPGMALASIAMAGDLEKPDVYNWTGFYVGVNGGYSRIDVDPIYGEQNFSRKHEAG
jgi:hypothetical protein